jgi:ATP-binding cassette subfamily B protein
VRLILQYLRPHKGLLAITILLMLADVACALLIPTLSAEILNLGATGTELGPVVDVGVRMIIAAAISGVCGVTGGYACSILSSRLGADLRCAVYDKSLKLSKSDFRQFGEASMVTRTVSDVTTIQVAFTNFMQMVLPVPVVFVISVLLTYGLDAEAAAILLVVMLVVLVAAFFIMRSASPLFRRLQGLLDRMGTILLENLTGVRVVRAFNKQEVESSRLDASFENYAGTAIRANRKFANLDGLSFLAVNGFVVIIYWVSGAQIAGGQFQIGDISAVIEYALLALMYVMMAQIVLLTLPRALECCARILAVLDCRPSIADPSSPLELAAGTRRDAPSEEVLAFSGVTFRFDDAEEDTLRKVSFSCGRGETVAIVGGTGSGKTTIASLVLRLDEASFGSVRFDGVDVRLMSQATLRDHVGLVQQTAWLFSGTVSQNLRYGCADATDEELWHALEVAQAADFVRELPGGLDLPVAQGGTNFSGGQRQRLSIARALVKRPELYVFDDSFSALDFKTDAALRHALAKETTDSAVLIIAQRVGTIRHADCIVVLDDGVVVGKGSHEELMQSCPVYQETYHSQTKEES